jgi:hypothetical protein
MYSRKLFKKLYSALVKRINSFAHLKGKTDRKYCSFHFIIMKNFVKCKP